VAGRGQGRRRCPRNPETGQGTVVGPQLHARTVRDNTSPYGPRYSDPSTLRPPSATVRTMTDRQQRNFRVAFPHGRRLWRVTQGLQASLQGLRRILRKPDVAFGNARDRGPVPGPLCWRTETQASFRVYQQPVGSVGYVGHPGFPAVALASSRRSTPTERLKEAVGLVAFDTSSTVASTLGFARPVNPISCMGGRILSTTTLGQASPSDRIRTGNLADLSGALHHTTMPQMRGWRRTWHWSAFSTGGPVQTGLQV
jgi:hypothetical protein